MDYIEDRINRIEKALEKLGLKQCRECEDWFPKNEVGRKGQYHPYYCKDCRPDLWKKENTKEDK